MNRKLLKISKLTISLCLFNLHAFAFNYDIVFTASGAATTVGDVVVQNTSLGTSITVPAGNVLRLTDGVSAIDALNQNNFSNLEVFTNAASCLTSISFYANRTGNANVSIYGLNGTKITELTKHLNEGTNSFDLSLSKGIFLVRIAANTYNYTAKVLIQNEIQKKSSIVFTGIKNSTASFINKNKSSGITVFNYIAGNKITLKANSGVYFTTVIDSPTESKTVNFNFDVCTDFEGKNYPTVKIGNLVWMAENLSTTRYRTGEIVENVQSTELWGGLATAAWCAAPQCVNNQAFGKQK